MNYDRLWEYVENTRLIIGVAAIALIFLGVGMVYLMPAVPEHPEKPDQLTKDNVIEYVSGYERAEVYQARDPAEDTDFHIDCTSALDRVTDRGHYVTTICHGGFTNTEGGSGHFTTDRSFYLINETATIRVPTEDQKLKNQTNTGSFRGTFYIANFDNRDYSIRVRVENVTTDTVALNQSYEVREKRGIGQSHVAPPEQYIITVSKNEREEVRYKWNITSDAVTRHSPAIYITSTGKLLIRPIPESS